MIDVVLCSCVQRFFVFYVSHVFNKTLIHAAKDEMLTSAEEGNRILLKNIILHLNCTQNVDYSSYIMCYTPFTTRAAFTNLMDCCPLSSCRVLHLHCCAALVGGLHYLYSTLLKTLHLPNCECSFGCE